MALDVQPPDPPSQTDEQARTTDEVTDASEAADEDYRRDEIEAVLADGAWVEGFEEWTAGTDLVESEFDLLVRHGVFDQFDFHWDPSGDQVDYHAPTPSDDVREALGPAADDVESELDALGRVIAETLENEYLVRDGEEFRFDGG
ncbi:hypothetical protein BRC76_03730 [Halobacteriales archaeon QH_8_67_36]|nr:MAG: hypothetical protein BRC76_03730 [Halobacteriales archaeon QH_8_67_36]